MKTRATILVRGDVQEAGYRSVVFDIARKLGLAGFVENLHDGRVRIVCEGKKEAIVELCDRIRIKDEYINVTSVRKSFSKPKGEFKVFEVRTDDLAVEMFRGYVTAGKYFRSLGNKIEGVGDKVDTVGEKVESVGVKVDSVKTEVRGVGNGIALMHDDMNRQFDRMDESYGEFSRKMDSLDDHIKEIRDDFKVLVKHFVGQEREVLRN